MQYFDYKGLNIRLTDNRPNQQTIQINIYNPNDAGHSYCAFIQTEAQTEENIGTPSDLLSVFKMIESSDMLKDLSEKALSVFQ